MWMRQLEFSWKFPASMMLTRQFLTQPENSQAMLPVSADMRAIPQKAEITIDLSNSADTANRKMTQLIEMC